MKTKKLEAVTSMGEKELIKVEGIVELSGGSNKVRIDNVTGANVSDNLRNRLRSITSLSVFRTKYSSLYTPSPEVDENYVSTIKIISTSN